MDPYFNTGNPAGPDNNMWFAEFVGNKIGQISPQSGVIKEYSITSLGTGSGSVTAEPKGIAAGPDNNMWLAESDASKIGKINPTIGIIIELPIGH